MAATRPRGSAATQRRIERSSGALSTTANKYMESRHDWYRALSAEDRSWVGLVAQAGIAGFLAWYRDPSENPQISVDVFGTAPRELTRSISLAQTLELVRAVVDVIEDDVARLAARNRSCARACCATHARSRSAPLRSTPAPPRPEAPGMRGWSRWWSTPSCVVRPTTRCSPERPRWAGGRSTTSP